MLTENSMFLLHKFQFYAKFCLDIEYERDKEMDYFGCLDLYYNDNYNLHTAS